MTRSIHFALAALFLACSSHIGDPEGISGTVPGGSSGRGSGIGSGSGSGSQPGGGSIGPGSGSGSTGGTIGMPCTQGVPATSQLARLTRSEFDNTARDLLGIDMQPSTMLAPDTVGSVDQRAWDGFQAAADALATQLMATPAARAKVIPCTPSGDGTACAQQFIQQFGQRAFRRPLTTAETTRFQTLYTNRAMITAGGTFDQAAQLIIKAFLLSPSFLTKAELSEAAPVCFFKQKTAYEMASRLSYLLWGSMPD